MIMTIVGELYTLEERPLAQAVRRAERMAATRLQNAAGLPPESPFIEPYPEPTIWFDSRRLM